MSEPIYVKIASATVFEIVDPDAITGAAAAAIGSREYGGSDAGQDRSDDLRAAQADLSTALLDLADPGRWAVEVDGVHELGGHASSARCDEDGVELSMRGRPDFGSLFSTGGPGWVTIARRPGSRGSGM